MNIEKAAVMYAAQRGERLLGVFTTPEKAQSAGAETVSEVPLLHIESSPASEQYVCMAKCLLSLISSDGKAIKIDHFEIGPMWGTNPQSAIAGLFAPGTLRKHAAFTELALFEKDAAYPDDPPENLCSYGVFERLFSALSNAKGYSERQIETDYVSQCLEKKAPAPPFQPAHYNRQARLLYRYVLDLAFELMIKDRSAVSVWYSPSARSLVRLGLAGQFTADELKMLTVIYGLEKPDSPAYVPDEYTRNALTRRLMALMVVARKHSARYRPHRMPY